MCPIQTSKSNEDRKIRIGIVGAGPAGLSTAHFLRKADYENVTVMEAASGIGGKAATFSVDGRGYDVGALMLGSRYREILGLAAELGCEVETFTGKAYDIDSGRIVQGNDKIGRYEHLMPRMKEYLAVRNEKFKGIDEPGHGAISETELAAPMRQWLRDRQMEYLGDCWGLAYTSAGYGYLDDDIPAAYLAKFIECSEGGIQIFKNGFHDFWERLSKDTDIFTDQRVVEVKRTSTKGKTGPITVVCKNADGVSTNREFDRLIFACGPRPTISALGANATSIETGLLSEVRTLDYYTIIASATGLPMTRGLTTIPKHCETRKQGAGHITGYHCAHEGVGTYIIYAYGREDFTPEDVIESIGGDIRAMGGELTAVHYQSRWDYFPHVNSLTMSRGFFSAFESIQGLNGCYFAGGMMDFEFTENCARYGRRLVERFFNGVESGGARSPTPPAISTAAARLANDAGVNRWVNRQPMSTDSKAKNWASALREAATECPDKVAFTWLDGNIKETATLTYGDLFQQSRAVAQYLIKSGVAPKTCVLLCYAPGLSFLPVLFGTMMADCIAVPLAPPNPATLAKDIRRFTYLTVDTGATLVLCERNYMLATSLMALKSKFMGGVSVKWPETLQWVVSERIVHGTDLVPENFGHDISPDDVAVIQYSSGSTGDPKGVMLSHGNLLHNVDLMSSEISLTPECSICFWVPQFHDLGLIGGFLNVIRGHAKGYVLSPLTFLQKPEAWLSAISQYRVNFTAAPNFAYELCARKIAPEAVSKLDLTCLRGAFNGAEPVRRPTLERFCKLTEPAGFDPAAFKSLYGQAETCAYACGFTNRNKGFPSCIKVDEEELQQGRIKVEKRYQRYPTDIISEGDEDPKGVLVGIGYPSIQMGVEVRIVDQERHVLRPSNVVGEIWVSSRSKGSGYWGRDDVNELTFRARLAGTYDGYTTRENGKEQPTWLRTGDLGFIYDGEVYISGRQKDLLIINGKNHYPQDIEVTTQEADPLVRPGCVIAVAGVGVSKDGSSIDGATEQLVLLAELRPNASPSDYARIRETIAKAIVVNHSVSPRRIVLLKARALPKTTSGKVQRSRAGAMLAAGDFKSVLLHDSGDSAELIMKSQFTVVRKAPPTKTISLVQETLSSPISPVHDLFDIRRKVVECIQPCIRPGVGPAGPPDINANLIETYALDSLAAVQISGQLQAQFNLEIDAALLFSEPTVVGISGHISELLKDRSNLTSSSASLDSGTGEKEVDVTAVRLKVIECMLPFMRPSIGPPGTPDISVNLIETYGFDSLAAVQFTAQLEAQFQIEIGVASLFEMPTIENITAQVVQLLGKQDDSNDDNAFVEPESPGIKSPYPNKVRPHAELTRSRSTVDLPRSRSTILGLDLDMESALDMVTLVEKISKTVVAFKKPEIGPQGPPALDANIVETYGFDSLTAVQFAGALQSEFGVEIATELLFNHPTIQSVAEHVSGLLGSSGGKNDARKHENAAPPPKSIFSPKVRRLIPSMEVLSSPPRKKNSASIGTEKKGVSREDISAQTYRAQPQVSQHETKIPQIQAPPQLEKKQNKDVPIVILPPKSTPKRSQIVTIHGRTKASGNRPILICVHPLLGSAACYLPLGNCLSKDQPIYALESSAFEHLPEEESMGIDENGNRVHRDESITVMANVYALLLVEAQPTSEFQLLGYSFGGLVAYSLARRLEELGRRVHGVFLVDAPAPLESTIPRNRDLVDTDADQIIADVDNQRMFRAQPNQGAMRQRVARHVHAMRLHTLDINKVGTQDQFSIHYFRASEFQRGNKSKISDDDPFKLLLEHPRFNERAFGWERYSGQVTLERSVPGHHFTVMNAENVRFWAPSVQQALDRNCSREKEEGPEAKNIGGSSLLTVPSKTVKSASEETLFEEPIRKEVSPVANIITVPSPMQKSLVQKLSEGGQPYLSAFLIGVLATILAREVRDLVF